MLTLAVAAALAPTAAGFSPPLDRPITYTLTDVREDRGRVLRFEVRHRVTFRQAENSLTADLETLGLDQAADRAGDMFVGMMQPMIGRHLIFRLDRSGRVIDIDDLDRHWDAHVAGIVATFAKPDPNPARAAVVAQIVSAKRATPRAGRIATFAEYLSRLIAEQPAAPAPLHAISVPGTTRDGAAITLRGNEQATAADDGLIHLERRASGTIAGTDTRLSLDQRIDPSTGIVAHMVERLETGGVGTPSVVTRTLSVSSPVS